MTNNNVRRQTATFTHGKLTRAQRKQIREYEAQAVAEARLAKKELYSSYAEISAKSPIPSAGLKEPHSLRSLRELTYQPHASTTRHVRALFPFVAQEALASTGMYIGHDLYTGAAFSFDPWELYGAKLLTDPNWSVMGAIGGGKSSLAKTFAVRGAAYGVRSAIPTDSKGEWTPVCKAMGGATIRVYPGGINRLNPLDEGFRPTHNVDGQLITDELWRMEVANRRYMLLETIAEALLGYRLSAREQKALNIGIATATRENTTPLLGHVVEAMIDPRQIDRSDGLDSVEEAREVGKNVYLTLQRLVTGDLAGMFDAPTTVHFDPNAPMTNIDLSGMDNNSPALPIVLSCTSAWMEGALRDPNAGRRFMIYDEFWKVAMHESLLRRAQEQWKLSRHWGISNGLIWHRVSDGDAAGDQGTAVQALAQGLMTDTGTRIFFRQSRDEIKRSADFLGLSKTEADILAHLGQGQSLWQVQTSKGTRSYVVQAALSEGERTIMNTDHGMSRK